MRSMVNTLTGDEIRVVGLRTEFVESPIGVEALSPSLSWRIDAKRHGVRQTAYRILVAADLESLNCDKADLWDSDRVDSEESVDIRYGGLALVSRQRCFWRVQIWDEQGRASAFSQTASWEMGLLKASDWTASWIAAEDSTMREDREFGLVWIRGPAAPIGTYTHFRRTFELRANGTATFFVASYGDTQVWMDATLVDNTESASVLMGPRRLSEIRLPLEAGRHVMAISYRQPDSPLEYLGVHGAEIAPFVRVLFDEEPHWRCNAGDWKVSLVPEAGWLTQRFDDTRWSRAESVAEPRPQSWPKQSAFLMRCAFTPSKPIRRARIYATALGGYEMHLNGSRVGDAQLTPETTDFRKSALYRVYDVTDRIGMSENILGAMVGDAWYASYVATIGRYVWGPPPRRLLAQLELTYVDDTREVVGTGPGWRIATSPIVSSEIYDGEDYDARLEQPGWSATGFDDSDWEEASIISTPAIALSAHIAPPIRRSTRLIARTVTEVVPGVFVFDFGQNFAGWCRLNVNGPAGCRVELRFGELLKDNGEIEQSNLRMARATDIYVLNGDPEGETFEPHFTYHGFRYVQVTGFPGSPTFDNLEGIVVHSDLAMTGTLNIGNPIIQQLWQNTTWSQRSNFVGIPTDCPQRDERLGWLGDANLFWDAAAFNMDVDAFTRRFLSDIRVAQTADGAYADFSPQAVRFLPGKSGGIGVLPNWVLRDDEYRAGATPGWADAGVVLPWSLWWRYGDRAVIEENWGAMQRYLHFVADRNPECIWQDARGTDYGDWLSLDAKGLWDATTPKDLVATAFWAHSVSCMAQMADATARHQDAERYRALWEKIARAFQTHFIRSDGEVGNDSQTGYILALRFSLVPRACRAAAAARLAHSIVRRGTLLSTGFLGTPYSLDVLADAGYTQLVYDLLLRTDFPSWGHMVSQGATTIWETWKGGKEDLVSSFNHYVLGAVCGFLFRRVAGIAPLEPGFRKIEVRPVLDPRVKTGGGVYDSVLGRISTEWQQEDTGGLSLDLTLPPNAMARVYLPAASTMAVTEGREAICNHRYVRELRRTEDQAILEVESGRYRFSVNPRRQQACPHGSD